MNILYKEYKCQVCYKLMKLSTHKTVIYKKIRRYTSTNQKNDKKINIRIDSIYEGLKVPLYILYFITFECFAPNKSISPLSSPLKGPCI